MENKNLIFKCRVCLSNKIENFKLNHFGFPQKSDYWKSFFCYNCGSVSEFKLYNKEEIYASSSYRNKKDHFNVKSDDENVLPPIDPWSAISFKRWKHIFDILKSSTSIIEKENIKMLDYGGYNGFLPYALNQKHKINSFVADLDKKGLKMAELFGSKVIDLSVSKVNEKDFDLITFVQVIEHLDYPKMYLEELKNNLSNEGVIYAEVPNLYGCPLGDEAHNSAFTKYSLAKLFKDSGLEIICCGYTKTPKESIKFDYFYTSEIECLFIVGALKGSNNKFVSLPNSNIPNNIKTFKYNLQLSYAKIMIRSISINLSKLSLRYFRTCILFLLYGVVELITLKIFKISLINNFIKKK